MNKKELLENVQQWIRRMDELYPDVPKEKLYFNVSYYQMQDILSVLKKHTRVIIEINGGVCQSVKGDDQVFVEVLDYDSWGETEEESDEDQAFRDLEADYEKMEHYCY
jgi:hypothetical protein